MPYILGADRAANWLKDGFGPKFIFAATWTLWMMILSFAGLGGDLFESIRYHLLICAPIHGLKTHEQCSKGPCRHIVFIHLGPKVVISNILGGPEYILCAYMDPWDVTPSKGSS